MGRKRGQINVEIVDVDRNASDRLHGVGVKKHAVFFGDGADKCQPVLGQNLNALFLPEFVNSATYLTQKAAEKFQNKEFEDVAYFEPYYLKDFIAGKKKE